MYGLCSKLVCLFKLACFSKPVKGIDKRKDTILQQNVSIFRRIWIRNV